MKPNLLKLKPKALSGDKQVEKLWRGSKFW